jgi:hypothetical protein
MRVLARAYGDRPLEREVVGSYEKGFYLIDPSSEYAKTDPLSGVGFPRSYVFEFDESLFEKLQLAFANSAQTELARLWASAHPHAAS